MAFLSIVIHYRWLTLSCQPIDRNTFIRSLCSLRVSFSIGSRYICPFKDRVYELFINDLKKKKHHMNGRQSAWSPRHRLKPPFTISRVIVAQNFVELNNLLFSEGDLEIPMCFSVPSVGGKRDPVKITGDPPPCQCNTSMWNQHRKKCFTFTFECWNNIKILQRFNVKL